MAASAGTNKRGGMGSPKHAQPRDMTGKPTGSSPKSGSSLVTAAPQAKPTGAGSPKTKPWKSC